jgi:hypothetical protein
MQRKYIDMVNVHINVNNKNTKKCPGVRLRFAMKYKTRFRNNPVPILLGTSIIMEAAAILAGEASDVGFTYQWLLQMGDKRRIEYAFRLSVFVRRESGSSRVSQAPA